MLVNKFKDVTRWKDEKTELYAMNVLEIVDHIKHETKHQKLG